MGLKLIKARLHNPSTNTLCLLTKQRRDFNSSSFQDIMNLL